MARIIPIQIATKVTIGSQAKILVADDSVTALYLRKFTYNGSGYDYVSEIAGVNQGDGLFHFAITKGFYYQCWKSAYPDNTAGNRVDAWHGIESGSPKYRWESADKMKADYIDEGTFDNARIPTLPQSKVTNLVTDLSDKASLSQPNDFQGAQTFEEDITIRKPISTDYPDPDLDTAESNLITNARLNHELATVGGTEQSPLEIDVLPTGTVETGKRYRTIYDAVHYAATTGGAGVSKIFNIIIKGLPVGTNEIVAAEGSFQNYVNIKSEVPDAEIICVGDTINARMSIGGARFIFGAGTTNGSSNTRNISNVTYKEDVTVEFHKAANIKGGKIEAGAVLLVADAYDITLTTNGVGAYPVVEPKPVFRKYPVFDNTNFTPQFEVQTDLVMPDDPTVDES